MPKRRADRRAERKHHARATLKVHELTKAGSALTLEIFGPQEKIGKLVIGRGSVYWYGAKRHSRKRIDWSRFAQYMDELAYDT
jgi:hypothetical protein